MSLKILLSGLFLLSLASFASADNQTTVGRYLTVENQAHQRSNRFVTTNFPSAIS